MTENPKLTESAGVPATAPNQGDETLLVPPPNFKERIEAAQRALANGSKQSLEIPVPPARPTVETAEVEPAQNDNSADPLVNV
ncbi:MAG: hypothetical protein ABI947_24125 [Chloroflexota bacterium]